MKSKEFSRGMLTVFDACLSTLDNLDFILDTSDIVNGKITATKHNGPLSFGHTFEITLSAIEAENVKVSVVSHSKGIHLIGWGTNDEFEEAFMAILTVELK